MNSHKCPNCGDYLCGDSHDHEEQDPGAITTVSGLLKTVRTQRQMLQRLRDLSGAKDFERTGEAIARTRDHCEQAKSMARRLAAQLEVVVKHTGLGGPLREQANALLREATQGEEVIS